MDAKYNWMIDNFAIRVAVNSMGFVMWLAASVALLAFAIS